MLLHKHYNTSKITMTKTSIKNLGQRQQIMESHNLFVLLSSQIICQSILNYIIWTSLNFYQGSIICCKNRFYVNCHYLIPIVLVLQQFQKCCLTKLYRQHNNQYNINLGRKLLTIVHTVYTPLQYNRLFLLGILLVQVNNYQYGINKQFINILTRYGNTVFDFLIKSCMWF